MAFERIRTVAGALPPEEALRMGRALRAGAILGLPTETVYGLAIREDRVDALLAAAQGNLESQAGPIAIHLPDRGSACRHVASCPIPAERLMDRYWPGPLTLVLKDARGEWIGLRLPARQATRDILRRAEVPVVMAAAARPGEPPAVDAASVERLFPSLPTAIVDDGPSELGQASTIVRIGKGTFEVLREGILTTSEVRRTAGRRVLLVCTGNTCRSPMAVGLLRRALARKLGLGDRELDRFGYSVESAGLVAHGGAPPTSHAVEILREEGIDISLHRTRTLSREMIRDSDLVLAMTEAHLSLVRELAPECDHKVQLLDPEGEDVPDPFGGEREAYRACLERIRRGVESVVEKL
jgi:protein-tyrosine phosphatase